MTARWEIARHDTGWTARFVAANHKTVVTSETYVDRRGAVRGIESVTGSAVWGVGNWRHVSSGGPRRIPVVDVDERTAP